MRLSSISATNVPPVKLFEVGGLADTVVLAGRNGVGKTRLVQAIIQALRNPRAGAPVRFVVEATCPAERQAWKKDALSSDAPDDMRLLTLTLQGKRRRAKWRSSLLQFESDRSIQRVKPYAFSWNVGDPWEEDISWDQTFGLLRDRFQDTLHSIFRTVQARRNKIAQTAEDLMKRGVRTMDLDFSDPLAPFKEAFTQLLAPKQLIDPDPTSQALQYSYEGATHAIDSLSSGEREVVNIVFDFLLRGPSDCIVFFDEPELHLHPELSYKLLQALQRVAGRNQFVYCTHSPDIITASLDQSVVFIGPPGTEGTNQALVVRPDDDTNEALKLLGHSVGIIALGKRLVLVEGRNASLDKQLYGALLGDRFPDLVLVPSEGRDVISSFGVVNEKILKRSLWGVEFFMLCDRDAVPPIADVAALEAQAVGRLRVLPRYHLENYLLDSALLASVFRELEPDDSWIRDPEQIDRVLAEIAATRLSHTVALYVSAEIRQLAGNVDIMPAVCHGQSRGELRRLVLERASGERDRIDNLLGDLDIAAVVDRTWEQLSDSLQDRRWITLFPGKQVFDIFAAKTKLGAARLKRAYVRLALSERPDTFEDIIQILLSFAGRAA
jgi:predicted ATPase